MTVKLVKTIMTILKCDDTDINRSTIRELRTVLNETLQPDRTIALSRNKVTSIKKVEAMNDQTEVYDIGMKNHTHPWFFANNMLVHNSAYFSATPILKDQIANGDINWDKDTIIEYYDAVCDEVDKSFAAFMKKAHNCPEELGGVIAAGREIVGATGIFITKKRYAILVYDDEGFRTDFEYDENGKKLYEHPTKDGKIKAMGLDLKRSDTPKYMQDFLHEILLMTLTGKGEQAVLNRIIEMRREFRAMHSWDKGTPKRVNKLTKHTAVFKKTGKCGVGHALAAINYNRLREMHGDSYSMEIIDGMKTMVCKLKDNSLGMKSIGIPSDQHRIPDWFKDLPFDDDAMENAIITKKISNLLGVMKWDLESSHDKTTFKDLFSFN